VFYYQRKNENPIGKVFLLYIFLILLSSIRLDLEFFQIKEITIIPEISSIIVYHFYIFKRRTSLFFIFILGIWNDATLNIPLGVSSLCYLILILMFSFFKTMTLKKVEEKIKYMEFFYFISCCAFFKHIVLNITGNISNSYYLLSLILSSTVFYILIFSHFLEFVDRKIFKK
jgi:membrane protein insertase Oxa1/YidC/SpoIIIJ